MIRTLGGRLSLIWPLELLTWDLWALFLYSKLGAPKRDHFYNCNHRRALWCVFSDHEFPTTEFLSPIEHLSGTSVEMGPYYQLKVSSSPESMSTCQVEDKILERPHRRETIDLEIIAMFSLWFEQVCWLPRDSSKSCKLVFQSSRPLNLNFRILGR